ncbi:MAG: phospho-sugar mutase [Clostridia bacterium]|nr:phospho-sugar mutase [Clostridia bacterium]
MISTAKQRLDCWLAALPEGELRAQLLAADDAELEDRFYSELEFGTAGLRGVLGAGTNRMNEYVVRRATQGVADVIIAQGGGSKGVCIAYDSRNMSAEFASAAADVLSSRGVRVYLFNSLRSVPQLSFTLRRLGCMGGIMITASHNPPQYNGYKVYGEDGGQLGPAQAAAVMERIAAHEYFGERVERDDALVSMLSEADDEPYYEATSGLLTYRELLRRRGSELAMVYTPLHGSGYIPVTTILCRAGITNLHVVKEQAEPDGDFPTVSVPNPEDARAYALAMELADRTGANCILATDPDSDRLGVAVRKPTGEFTLLTGNQIAVILIKHILTTRESLGTLPDDGVVVKSIVSTSLADAICRKYGVECLSVPTGFRFISEVIERCSWANGKEFLFGFEESYGFLSGGFSRDKDAILAAMLVAEVCVCCMERGMTLYDYLNGIYEEYGYYREDTRSYSFDGKAGMEHIDAIMQSLRCAPPECLASRRVIAVEDYMAGKGVGDGGEYELDFPRLNMIRLLCEGDMWVCARPSGTEPKIKFYVALRAGSEEEARTLADEAHSALSARI